MPDLQKLNESINALMKALIEFKNTLKENEPNTAFMQPVQVAEEYNDFESLRKALESNKWPEAVNPNLICKPNEEAEKLERGRAIIELMIEEDLKDLKFLDFGCGEGQCAFSVADKNPIISVGYDIKNDNHWDTWKSDKVLYTTNFNEVIQNGPYDIILLFDVLDHVKNITPVELLKQAKQVLKPDGKIYMRCHPYISRHGTHLYHELNKAFVHLVFSPNELKVILPDSKWSEENIGVVAPIRTYGDFIANAQLTVVSRRDITEKVEPFFKIPKIAERIMKNTKNDSFPEFQMGLQFLDFVIKH